MVDVPGELDALLFDAVCFHRSEGIVGPMLPLMIEVGKILQIGEMPSETRAAEDQAVPSRGALLLLYPEKTFQAAD